MASPLDDSDIFDAIQTAVGSAFTLERELGGGGMSRVFLAEETSLHRQVVIKVLRPELAAGVSADRFAREVRLAAQLQQANIVPVISAGEANGLPYYTMPFVAGQSLRALLETTPQLPVAAVIDILVDVARALAYAHERGIVHRDIKPDNILLSGGTAVVTDFGIAKALSASRNDPTHDTLTSIGVSLGTPAYMAPEQAMGEPTTDHRADLYALGVVGYEMLAGERPFTSTSIRELVRAHVMETPRPIAERRDGVPRALVDAIEKSMAKAPEERPANAEALLEMLRVARRQSSTYRVEDLFTPPADVTPAQKTESRGRGKRWAISGVVAAATLAAVAVYAWRSPHIGLTGVDVDPAHVVIATPTSLDASTRDAAARFADAAVRTMNSVSTLRGVVSVDDARDDRDAVRRARAANAGTVVIGTATRRGADSVEIRARILDTRRDSTTITLAPIVIARSASDSVVAVASDRLYASIVYAASPLLGAPLLPLRGAPPFAAVREILAGAALERGTTLGSVSETNQQIRLALDHYARALTIDSTFFQAVIWKALYLADYPVAYYAEARTIGDTVRAQIEPHIDRLSGAERALYDYIRARQAGRVPEQIGAMQRLRALAPEVALLRQLPGILLDQFRPREALEVLQTLPAARDGDGKLIPPDRDARRVYLMSEIYHALGDRQRNVEMADKRRALAPDDIVSVRAQLVAAAWDGDSARVMSLVADARSSPPTGGYSFFGDVVLSGGQELEAHGHRALGVQLVHEAIKWFESRSPNEMDRYVQLRKALAYYADSNVAAAWAMVQPLVNSDTASPLYVGLAARIAAVRRDSASVKRYLATLTRLGDVASGAATQERAFVAAELGQKDEAVRLLRESFAQGIGWNVWWRLHWFPDLTSLHGYPPFEALIRPAG